MFPVDPNAPGGPERSEYLRHAHLDSAPLRKRFPTPHVRRQFLTPEGMAADAREG